VGIESTIVDCTRGVPVLLRPAPSRATDRRGLRHRPLSKEELPAHPARLRHAGGPLRPNAKVRLMDAKALQPAWTCWAPRQRTWRCTRAAAAQRIAHVLLRRMPDDAGPPPSSCLPRCAVSTTPAHG
jgi:L-threonylcarbamoyladenylate synthase